MRYVNEKRQNILESEIDLSKGYLVSVWVIKEDAPPIDDITKFAYSSDDYEEVQMYVLNSVRNNSPTQLDIIEAQVTYTAMMTDTLLEG